VNLRICGFGLTDYPLTERRLNLKSSLGNRLSLSRHTVHPKQNHPKLDTKYIAGRVPRPNGLVQTALSKMTRRPTYARASTLSRRVIPDKVLEFFVTNPFWNKRTRLWLSRS
jgi:hypothetical protein